MNPSPELRSRVLALAAARPSPTRPEVRRRAAALLALGVIVALAVFDGGRAFDHGAGRPGGVTAMITLGWSVVAALLTFVATSRARSTLARRPDALGVVALATPFLLFVWMQVWNGSYVEPFERVGWRCFALTVVLTASPLAAFFVLRRGGEPRAPALLGAMAGAASGAWASVLVHLWCPLVNAPHAALGHALPLALVIGVGALAGARVLGIRSST